MKMKTPKFLNSGWKRRISLVLIFTLLVSTFMYQGWFAPETLQAAPTANGRLIHSVNATTPADKSYSVSLNNFSAGGTMPTGAAQTFIVDRASPTSGEHMAGYVTTGGQLYIMRWNGTAWSNEWNIAVGGAGVNGRRFDIAYEKTTGDCMVAYSNNTTNGQIAWRKRVASTGIWTTAATVSSARITTQAINDIRMASNPTAGSNGLAMAFAGTGTTTETVSAMLWSGSAWTPEIGASTTATNSAAAGDISNFDIAYESTTGDVQVATNVNGANGLRWAAYTAGAWSAWTTDATTFAVRVGTVRLAADPRSNQILMVGTSTTGTTNVYVGIWSGTAWGNGNTGNYVLSTTFAVNTRPVAGGWLTNGANTVAVIVYGGGTLNTINYGYWNGTTWSTAQTGTVTTAASTDAWVDIDVDPTATDTLMVTWSDSASDLWAKRLVYGGGTTFTWTNSDGGAAITTTLASITTQNFAFDYYKVLPPTVTSTSPNTLGQGTGPTTVTITGSGFTGASAVSFNDANITLGAFTIVNDTTITVPVTIALATTTGAKNVSVTGTGGTGTGTGIFTVAAFQAAPTVTATSPSKMAQGTGPTTVTITGTGFTNVTSVSFNDANITLGAFTVVNSTTITVPVTVALATTGGSKNVSVTTFGGTGTGTGIFLVTLPSSVSSCAGCHGYGATFNDGTARNNPPGTFVGSHNTHVAQYSFACSKCHVTPATTTSADFAHRTGVIQMSSPINGDTGGAYGKGTSWTQTNNPAAMQACSNVYCHSQGTSMTSNVGETRTSIMSQPLTTLNWGDQGVCSSCHGYPPNYTNGTTAWGAAKANSHLEHPNGCEACHNATTTTNTTITGFTVHANRTYTIVSSPALSTLSYTYAAAGGRCSNISCHNNGSVDTTVRIWGGAALESSYDCVSCHKVTQAICSGPLAGTGSRRAVSLEFANTWSHKRSAGGAVTKNDCCVCHMEGDAATGAVNHAYHGDGYVDLRDADTGGPVMQVAFSGAGAGAYSSTTTTLRFAQFSRDLSKNLESDPSFTVIASIQINHCLKCHDTTGAGSTLARVPLGTAMKPFNTTITGQVAPYNINGNGNVVSVATSFTTTNSSYHPVMGRANNSYAQGTQMIAPWNLTKTNGRTDQWGYLMSCWDCHAPLGASNIQTSTVTAHGAPATLRGTIRVAGTTGATNLCINCHATKYADITHVSAGSAVATGPDTGAMTNTYWQNCSYCHAYGPENGTSGATSTSRPLRGEDAHGFNDRTAGTVGSLWTTSGVRPYAFFRTVLVTWSPLTAAEGTPTHTCLGNTGNPCDANMNGQVYTPGGSY